MDISQEIRNQRRNLGIHRSIPEIRCTQCTYQEPHSYQATSSNAIRSKSRSNEHHLDDAGIRKLEYLRKEYKDQLKDFEVKSRAIKDLQKHVIKTIGNYYYVIEKVDNLAEELKLLYEKVAPSDYTREMEIISRYNNIQQSTTASSSKVEEWIAKWQKALADAQAINIPEVQGIRPPDTSFKQSSNSTRHSLVCG